MPMISQTLHLWIDGLAAAIHEFERWFEPQRRFELRAGERAFLLRSLDHKKSPLTASVDRASGELSSLAPALRNEIKGSAIQIVVPSTGILENQLEPLPAESRPYVENVVRHHIETLFPWRASETLFAVDVADQPGGLLAVNVRATSRTAVAAALDLVMACGAERVTIVRDDEQNSEAGAISAFVGPENQRRFERARSIARYLLLGLSLLAAGVIGDAVLTRSELKADIAALEQTIAERQAALQQRPEHQTVLGLLEAKKQEGTIAVLVVEELSKILPDDTYLMDFALDGAQLRITGVSAHAADLVPLLEGTGHFKNAAFYAPTTRQPDGTDRFSMETAVISNFRGGQ